MPTLTPHRRRRELDVSDKRLPQPENPTRPRCIVDESEQRGLEDLAHACRLSIASLLRCIVIDAIANPDRVEDWKKIAQKLLDESDAPRPGRPKKPENAKDKKPKK